MTKLLYITNGINGPGGLERVLSIKASLLTEKYGYDVYILSLNNAHKNPFYRFSPKIKMFSVDVFGNPLNYLLKYKKGTQKIVDMVKPNIISVCDDGLKGFFLPKVIKTEAKWIYERHASILLNTSNSLKGKLVKRLMQKRTSDFDKFVVLTPTNIKEWKSNNVIAIPNPVSFETEEQSTLNNNKIIVVGSHSYNKGYDTLLKIWSNIEKKYPDWQLNIYGKIDKDKTFVNLAGQLQLKNVLFHSPVKTIKEKYLESSIMLLTSRSEGFGMVLIEAMSCGVPCISFDCPSGPRDIITDKEDGFLIKDQNPKAFENALSLLIENDKLRKQMGTKAKENSKRFDMNIIMQKWLSLFLVLKNN